MNRKRENGMLLLAALTWVAITLIAVLCCSCTTKKMVTETIYVHDTLRIAHSDTITLEKWNYRHDTLRIESERIVTLLQPDKSVPAETIRVETNNWHYQHEVVKDSASKVVARVDSILRALDKQRERQEVKVKPPIAALEYIIFVAIILGACLIVLKSRIF